MRPLKFVMLTTFYPPYYLGGDALHVYYLSNELAKLGHEVHVIHSIDAYYLNRKKTSSGDYPNHERVSLHPLKSKLGIIAPLVCGFAGLSHPLASKALELVEEIQPDVVHHHNIVGFGPTVLDARAPKVFYTAHDYWLICPRNNLLKPDKTFCDRRRNCFACCLLWKRPPQLWRYTGVLDKKLSHVDTIIAPSNYMRNTLESAGISRPIVTTPNFVPEPEEAGVPIYHSSYFLFVGLLEEHKGVLNLVEAFCHAKEEIDANLLIVGIGSLEDKLHQVIAQNGCQSRVKLLGKISDRRVLTNLYANALALVIPSIGTENAPLVALEALACGTPVIASNQGGLPEIAEPINPQLVFSEGSITLLADTLKSFDKANYDRNEIRQIARERYSAERFIHSYLELFGPGLISK